MKIVLVSLANNDTLFLEFGKILRGEAGLNAYELWLEQGNTGTIDDFFYLRIPAIQEASKIMEAEAERVAAEEIRIANELLRQQADVERNADIYNITVKKPLPQGSYYSFTDAGSDFFVPNHMPIAQRKEGIMVVAKTSETEWIACQFRGDAATDFTNKSAWSKIFPITEADVAHLLVLPLRMEIDTQGDSFLAWGETMDITCRVFSGFEDVTDHVATWKVVRNTGNEVEDTAWLLKSKVLNFSGTLRISHSLAENDLAADGSISTLFLFNATMDDGFMAQYELII